MAPLSRPPRRLLQRPTEPAENVEAVEGGEPAPAEAEPFFEADRVESTPPVGDVAPIEDTNVLDEPAPLDVEPAPAFDGVLDLPELQQPAPQVPDEADEHAHLPDHTRAEIAAGRKAVVASKNQAGLEHEAGQRAREHHEALARRKPQREVTPESTSLPPNPRYANAFDRKMSAPFLAGGKTPSNKV